MEVLPKLFLSIAFLGCLGLFVRLYIALVAKPERLRAALRKQGINGPSPTILLGNIWEIKKSKDIAAKAIAINGAPENHNCGSFVLPFFDQWNKKYGEVFMFSLGTVQIMHVTQPDMVREITTYTSLDLGKPTYQTKQLAALLGQGILTSNGSIWAHQKKILAPELYTDKVKGMINVVHESALTLINSWKDMIQKEGGIADIKIDEYMKHSSGNVISGACFGSNYAKGEEIFKRLRAIQEISSKRAFAIGIPGMRHVPTKSNREAWTLEKETKTLILKIVNEKNEAAGNEKNLLQILLESAKNSDLNQDDLDRFIVDNCKTIYFAGYETTAVTATWCLMLLAANPDWQNRIRAEVLEICQGEIPNADMIRKMKQLSMVINETLRLYPPGFVVAREALSDMTFGDIDVPKGVNLWIPVITLHTDPEIWGPDSYKFNPERFANGITSACKFPHCYMPFGIGPRVCLGQHLALVELKILISMIMCNFCFSISPKYIHSPSFDLGIVPGYGVNLLVKNL